MFEFDKSQYMINMSRPAVIDIGSNSVRLVIYENFLPIVTVFYNEKFSCKLGCFTDDGYLSPKAKAKTLDAITRFVKICEANHVTTIKAVATAAIRDAKDGLEFAETLSQKTGIPICVISGQQEAYFAAMGVSYKMPQASGIVGDLGGGSLELASVGCDEENQQLVSLPLGVLRIQNDIQQDFDMDLYQNYIDKAFNDIDFDAKKIDNFYCVGGSWRALLWFYMSVNKIPLHILQGFSVPADKVKDFIIQYLNHNIDYTPKEYRPHISKRRFEMMPVAALLLLKLIEKFNLKNIIVSVCGVREGVLVDNFAFKKQHHLSPSLAFAISEARTRARNTLLYPYFIKNIQQILPNLCEKFIFYTQIITHLSDIAFRRHSDYRAHYVFDFVLYANLDDLTHYERILIASAVAWRYDPNFVIPSKLLTILKTDPAAMRFAYLVALILRYLYSLTGISHHVAKELDFKVTHDKIIAKHAIDLPMGETTQKRLNMLHKHLF